MSEQKSIENDSQQQSSTVQIYIMGKPYTVPAALTIMKAIEYSGFQMIRGAGCRGGFCGACATVYRLSNDYYLYTDLACQRTVENGMYIALLPFIPAESKKYSLEYLEDDGRILLQLFPVIARCVACNTCTKACPQELQVMDYVQASIRGDISAVADLSFNCIQCGLCAVRCPAMIVPYHVAQLARRIYGRFEQPKSPGIQKTLRKLRNGDYNEEIHQLESMNITELKDRYATRKVNHGE